MIENALTWIYLINAVFLINHEMDSAYWKEWELFKMKGGVAGFLLLHFPIFIIMLWGLLEVSHGSPAGYVLSIIFSTGGMGALGIHTYFLKKGHEEFKTPVSLFILIAMFIISAVQMGITIHLISIKP